jgi:hypothetical protein
MVHKLPNYNTIDGPSQSNGPKNTVSWHMTFLVCTNMLLLVALSITNADFFMGSAEEQLGGTVAHTNNNDYNDNSNNFPAGEFMYYHWEPFICANGRVVQQSDLDHHSA